MTPKAGVLKSEHGCEFEYEYYQPQDGTLTATVVLAHGFKRNLNSQRGWALQWLDHGIATAVISFCNSTLLNGHHARNADDLIALRHHLAIKNPIYAGFSAGGLAAYLAALEDGDTRSYLGFDSVDSGNLALKTSTPLTVPALFLMAPPSSCNAKNNFFPIIERYDYPVQTFSQATHCHFEFPYDTRCAWICGKSKVDVAEVQAQIFNSTTQWIGEQSDKQ
jgi:pimeloyl-ACP methyl ester carboxylesterase